MLSHDLKSLQTWFEASHRTGAPMPAAAAEAFAAALGVAVETAANMERHCVVSNTASVFDDVALSPETARLIQAARAVAGVANVVMLHAARGPLGRSWTDARASFVTKTFEVDSAEDWPNEPRPIGGGDAT